MASLHKHSTNFFFLLVLIERSRLRRSLGSFEGDPALELGPPALELRCGIGCRTSRKGSASNQYIFRVEGDVMHGSTHL